MKTLSKNEIVFAILINFVQLGQKGLVQHTQLHFFIKKNVAT